MDGGWRSERARLIRHRQRPVTASSMVPFSTIWVIERQTPAVEIEIRTLDPPSGVRITLARCKDSPFGAIPQRAPLPFCDISWPPPAGGQVLRIRGVNLFSGGLL